MKYSMDTYMLYSNEKIFTYSIRITVTMKDEVDIDTLRYSVNAAAKRYPYFMVEVVLGPDGGYDLLSNQNDIAVIQTREDLPNLGSKEVNHHLLYVDTKGCDINFNISHSLCGGRGVLPWVMTTIYQYVTDKYDVVPYAPKIRKPESDLLPGEADEPTLEMLTDEEPIYQYKSKKPVVMALDYMNGMYNPFMRDPNYYFFTFEQSDIMAFARENDASVASFFLATVAKSLDKILPERYPVIGGEIAHNSSADFKLPNSHCNLLSHVHIDYKREYLRGNMERLGTLTRSQIILQTDPSVTQGELRKLFALWDGIDKIKGTKAKRAYYSKNDPNSGKEAQHGTFIVNYTGNMDWGEVADYVESYGALVDGHILLEVTSMADKIFVTYMQLIKETKYIDAFCDVMKELKIPYKVKGPFPNKRPKHELPE